MIDFEDKMFSIIDALYKSKLLEKCIISGSWAMYFYKEIFEGFIPPIVTIDFDIFLPKISSIKHIKSGQNPLFSYLDLVMSNKITNQFRD